MYSRPITLIFCIFLITSLLVSGCQITDTEKENEEQKQWQGVITIWDFPRWPDKNSNRFGWIEQKIAEFEKENPGVFIQLRRLKWEYGMIELKAAVSAGVGPDIAPIAADYDFIANGYLEPLDEVFTPDVVEKYHPMAIDAVKYKERIYGFPWFMTTYGLFVNLDFFKDRNVKPPENGKWTFQEFADSVRLLSYDEDKDGEKEHHGFNVYLAPGNYQAWGFLTMDGAKLFDGNGRFALNKSEGISALTKMVDLNEKYQGVPEKEYGTVEENKVWGDFAEKQNIAIYPAGPWAIKVLQEKKDKGEGFEFDIVSYPDGKTSAKSISIVSAYGILKQSDESKKEVCKKFLKHITSEEEQEYLAEYMVFPVYKDIFEKSLKNPYMKKMSEILDESVSLPKVKNWSKIDEVLTTQIRQALLGKKTPKQALEDAESEINKICKATYFE